MKRFLSAPVVAAQIGLSSIMGLACTKENHPPEPAAQTAAAPAAADLAPTTVVATLGGQPITAKELDESIKTELAQLDQKYVEDRYKTRLNGLENMVFKKLVAAKAKAVGKTDEEWIREQVESKTPPATEAEAREFFDKNRSMMPSQDFDQVKDKLIPYLTNKKRQDAVVGILDGLKKEANFVVKLDEPEQPKVNVEAVGPSKGPKDAPVTIVEFSDFQCPFCSKVEPTITRIMADYAGKVRVVFRDYPLPFHEHAEKAAEASHCAEDQGKYWEMHDAMFEHQDQLAIDGLKKLAESAGLDAAKFASCLDGGSERAKVDANAAAGTAAGVNGTPHFFVNGHSLSGAVPYEDFKKMIDKELDKVAAK
jgi:protein-disulfide isomerase